MQYSYTCIIRMQQKQKSLSPFIACTKTLCVHVHAFSGSVSVYLRPVAPG